MINQNVGGGNPQESGACCGDDHFVDESKIFRN